MVADGPGKENTLIFFSSQIFMRSEPGSEIIGVPASDIIAIDNPACNFFIINGIEFFELNL
jgi:hypothetical protein